MLRGTIVEQTVEVTECSPQLAVVKTHKFEPEQSSQSLR